MRIVALLLFLCSIDAGAQAPAQRLERGNGPEPATLDAHRCQEVACGNILRDLYEGLVTEDGAGRLIPGTAERWDVSADGRTWTFHLRAGLRWSNGEALDAPQIVASFRRAFAPDTAAPFAEQFYAVVNARAVQAGDVPPERLGIDAPDAHTVRIRTTRRVAMPALLTLPIAFPVYLPAVARDGAQHTRPGHLVSNGAYMLTAWTPQANLVVAKNRWFHDAAAVRIPEVRFHVTEDAAAELQRFAAGDLDITETVPPQPLPALRARFGDRLRISPYLGAFWLGLNLTKPPLRDAPALREALSLAVDRDRLTRSITGLGETPAYGIVPPGIPGAGHSRLRAGRAAVGGADASAARCAREGAVPRRRIFGKQSAGAGAALQHVDAASPARACGRGDVARHPRRARAPAQRGMEGIRAEPAPAHDHAGIPRRLDR